MNERTNTTQRRPSPLGRAHRSLWILIGIAILMAGALTTALAAPPSPLTGLSFALSAMIFVVVFALATRVTIALERARRMARPTTASELNPYPVLSRLVRRTTATPSRKNH